MARPLKLEVHESADYLLKSLRQARSAAQAERLRLLGRSPSTITRWLRRYREEGLAGLLEERTAPGKAPRIDGELLEKLKARLDSPEGFASYGEVQQWLEAQSGEPIPYKTVHKTVRYRLGAKLKAPRPQNIKQDPAAVDSNYKFKNS
ncbi:MAG: helix-turn-helix domain-containing protein [Leptolyngbya sp.]|nr:MAG: helix-turn-helix domain-containing protein [Leptolyngbya sp.]